MQKKKEEELKQIVEVSSPVKSMKSEKAKPPLVKKVSAPSQYKGAKK